MEVVSIYLYFTLYFYFINTTKVNKYFYCTISNTFNASRHDHTGFFLQ